MMVLHNLRVIESTEPVRIGIREGTIVFVQTGRQAESGMLPGQSVHLNMEGALVFPGLVNSHDHLEFNSFPALGSEKYPSYVEWGERIHDVCKSDIDRVLGIPMSLRVQWGLYKNLLGGVTTVVHHGPAFPLMDPCVGVYEGCQSIHSVRLGAHWRRKLNDPRQWGKPYVIHIGEGIDLASQREVDRLIRWNALGRPLVGVHGVSMSPNQAARFKALIWCPGSNFFLYGKTARVDQLGRQTALLFGTDSTLTGSWNIWDHLRTARDTGLARDRDLFDMVTLTPANIWKLSGGALAPGKTADLTIARARGSATGWDAFYDLEPKNLELVIRDGKVVLTDDRWKVPLEAIGCPFNQWSRVRVGDRIKHVPGNLPALAKLIRTYDPQAYFPFICMT